MWTVKRENGGGDLMTALDIAQIIFIVTIFGVGVVGFIRAATSDDKK